MIPQFYRRMKKSPFNPKDHEWLWGKDMAKAICGAVNRSLQRGVAVDITPIDHIIHSHNIPPNHNLFPPWNDFYFEHCFHDGARVVGTLVIVATRDDTASAPPEGDCPPKYAYQCFGLDFDLKKSVPTILHDTTIYVHSDGSLHITDDGHIDYDQFLPQYGPFLTHAAESEKAKREINEWARSDVICIRRLVSFMQARNIKARPKYFPDYKPRKKQRHKVIRYHELVVVKPSINEINQPHGEGVKGKALHSVRGHIMHVTKEKPLFGNPRLYGDFFIPQHVRGDIKHGKVDKNYKVKGL